jgi:hypothetical protein
VNFRSMWPLLLAVSLSWLPAAKAEEGGVATGQRCGVDWGDANGKCGAACPNDSSEECPHGEDCFSELDACPDKAAATSAATCPVTELVAGSKRVERACCGPAGSTYACTEQPAGAGQQLPAACSDACAPVFVAIGG